MGEAARSTGSNRGGRVIAGRYRIVKLLGRGGMAEVYLVAKVSEIERAHKLFALKRILPQYADDPLRVNCFLDEVAVVATMDHPNIVHAHDWGQDEDAGGGLFLVMDFVRGMDLNRLGDKLAEHAKKHGARYPGQELGILPPPIVAWAILQSAIGLDYLHRQKRSEGDELGLIHRDISPDNIMMDIRGHVRINDLGIAKALKGDQSQASATQHATGKPLYMPPEQWKGLAIDATADLYALGITAYELLTRRHPYDNPTLPNEEVMNKVIRAFQTDRVAIAQLAPEIPPPMQRMLERLIRGNRGERQQSAEELFEPLKETIAGYGMDLHAVQKWGGELVKLVYERPDTVAEMPGYKPESDPSASQPDEAHPPNESSKRPISRPSGESTARAKPTPRTTPLGPARDPLAEAGVQHTAPLEISPAPGNRAPSRPRPIWFALGAAILVLLGLCSFGVAYFVWPSHSVQPDDVRAGSPATPRQDQRATLIPDERPAPTISAPQAQAPPAAGGAPADPVVPAAQPQTPPTIAQLPPTQPQAGPQVIVEQPIPQAVPPPGPAPVAQPARRQHPTEPLTPSPIGRIAPVQTVPATPPRGRGDTPAGRGGFGI